MKISIKVLTALMILIVAAPLSLASNPEVLRVKVLAGNGNLPSAEKIAAKLTALGYDIDRVDNALRSDFSSTTIFYAKPFETKAIDLALQLNLERSAVKPLSFASAFDLVVVTGLENNSVPSPADAENQDIQRDPGAPSPENKTVAEAKEVLVSSLAGAHALFITGDYDLARHKYEASKSLLSSTQNLCKPETPSKTADVSIIPVIQILSQDKDLGSARRMAGVLAKHGYVVSTVDYAYRSDLVEKAIFYKPTLKDLAVEIVSKTGQSLSLLPLQWPSQFDFIIVSSKPVSEDVEIKDIHQKLAELHEEESRMKHTMDILMEEAFHLQNQRNCTAAFHKFGEVKTYISLVESICETSRRLAPQQNLERPTGANEPSEPGSPSKTSTVLTLDEALKTALLNNSSIKEALEKSSAALEEKKSAGADFLPRASFAYTYTRLNEAPSISLPDEITFMVSGTPVTISLPGGGLAMGSEDIYTWNLTLSQPLFTGFGLLSQYEIKKLNVEIMDLQKQTLVLNLVRDVKKGYFNVLLAEKVQQVTKETVQNLKSHESDAEQFYNQGMIPYNDLLKAKVALANAVQENERTGGLLKTAGSSLNVLLNYDVNRRVHLEDLFMLSPTSYQLSELLHEAVENRPELDMLKLAIKQTDQAIRAVKSTNYPQVALVGRYEQTGQDVLASDNDFGDVESASVTLQANMALFKGGKTGYDISKYRHEKNALEKKYEGAEKGIQLEVKNVYEGLVVSEKNISTSQKSLAQAQENWRITNLQYREQIATSTDVLDARTYLSQAELNYYRALYGYMISVAELERAVAKPYVP